MVDVTSAARRTKARDLLFAAAIVALIGTALYWTYYGSFDALPSCTSQYAMDNVPDAVAHLPGSLSARLAVIKMTDLAAISATADKVTCSAMVRLSDLSNRAVGYSFSMKGGDILTDVTLAATVQ